MALPKDFVAASSVPLILSILQRSDSYGYALIQQVRALSGEEMEWTDGMLYPILHRLEKRGLIESYWGTADSGRKRKYYRIQPAGRDELEVLRSNWQKINEMLHRLDSETRGEAHV